MEEEKLCRAQFRGVMRSNGLKQLCFRNDTLAGKSVEAGSQLWQEEMGLLSWMRGDLTGCGRRTWERCSALAGREVGAHWIQPQTVSLKS